MDLTDFAAVAAALLGAVGLAFALESQVPQVVRTVLRGRVAGVSFASMGCGTASASVWVLWAVAAWDPWLFFSSVVYVVGHGAVAWKVARGGGDVADWPVAAVWAAVLAVAGVAQWAGLPVIEATLAVGAAVFGAPQVFRAWVARDNSGISRTSWAVYGVDGAVWAAYGVLTGLALPLLWGATTAVMAVAVFTGLAFAAVRARLAARQTAATCGVSGLGGGAG